MGFLKILLCCVETLIILSPPVHGQFPKFPQNPFSFPSNPLKNFPGNFNNFNPLSQPGDLNNNGGSFPNPFNPPTNPVNTGPGNFNNFNPPGSNPLFNPVNRSPGNFNNFNPPANNPFTNPVNPGPGNFNNFNPPANNPFTNPVNSGPGNFNNFNPPANNPFSKPVNSGPGNFNNFKPLSQPSNFPSSFPTNRGGITPFPNPFSPATNPVNNFSPGSFNNRNPPPFNNFNRPPVTPQFQPPRNPPGGFRPLNPNVNNPPFNRPPANLNNFQPLPSNPQSPSYPQSPSNLPHQVFGQKPFFPAPPPSFPFHPPASGFKPPSNHSIHPPVPPIHHNKGKGSHPHAKPPPPPPPPAEDPLEGLRIVCIFNNKHYFRNEFSPDLIDPTLCTYLNYEFAMLDPKSFEMISSEPELDIQMGFYEEAVNLKKKDKALRVLISLGGWADSTEKYSILAADKILRKNFVQKAVEFIKKHEFDGMDFAWEYPNCWQGALGVSPKDKENFVLLLKDLRKAFKPENLILSISVGAVKKEIEAAYDIPEVSKQVDFINVMTYDMHGPWEPRTGHHTQFDAMPWDEDPYWNSKGALKVWVEGGAPKLKLNLGIALYGKTFTLADPNIHGMNAPSIGVGNSNIDSVEGGFILYNTMCQWLNDGNWTEKEDRRSGFYAYSGDQWSCYDPPMSVVRKSKFIVEEGYGGLLFKDLGGDDYLGICFSMPFPLLKMARFEILHRLHYLHHHG